MINTAITAEMLNKNSEKTINHRLGIEILEVNENYISGRMPVDERTHQPYGILHGGASVVLAESLGSIGAGLSVDMEKFNCVGLDINANHIRPVKEGYVYGKASPLHIGKTTQVWEIKITNEAGQLVCISRITMAVIAV